MARKYDGSKKRSGGWQRISEELEQLIVQIARNNKTWGSRRIKGQLKYLGHEIFHTTIDKVLKRNGYDPSPERLHQGLDNGIIEPPPQGSGEIVCSERLGGLLKSYRRATRWLGRPARARGVDIWGSLCEAAHPGKP